LCVFEVKRDLRKGNVREDAVEQLAGYVAQRSLNTGQRYVGVLTDGCEWHLYRLTDGKLGIVSSFILRTDQPDVEGLCVWLEGVLATGEAIAPTPTEIARLLGAGTPCYQLNIEELSELYLASKETSTVQLKRELWAKLLTTAQGTAFRDEDQLFVQHTLLVVIAEAIAHAVIGLDPTQIPPSAMVSGQQFRRADVRGVVEEDFFDWVIEVPGGDRWVQALCRQLVRFEWMNVEHDVMKVLYESVIPTEQRKQLGEYYTPDWLAQRIVEKVVSDPLESRLLDPSCGSGTFLFHAVKRYLEAADEAEMTNQESLVGACSHVMGMDLHPVAVTLARVTYLLAIGTERLSGDRGSLSIPVFLGDSLQWGQEETLQTQGSLVVAADDLSLFPTELRFPNRLVADAAKFDALVSELADRASQRTSGSHTQNLSQLYVRFNVQPDERPVIERTFKAMCGLHDQGRDHIWGYYVRNLARPRWLARKENNVDVLVGNPPWLAYRFMTEKMQQRFQALSRERGLWAGAKSATHVDLSALFVVRCIERYLKKGGRFGFVMPLAVLSRQHYSGFREGDWRHPGDDNVSVEFVTPWDLHAVKPPFFLVPASVVQGRRSNNGRARSIGGEVERWSGRLPSNGVSWEAVNSSIRIDKGEIKTAKTSDPASPYGERFSQGATLVPRMLCFVEDLPAGPLGKVRGTMRVRSRRTKTEKAPWKNLPGIEATLESPFVLPIHVGDTILPHRPLAPLLGIVPWDGKKLLHGGHEHLERYPGLHEWMTRAEALWNEHRSSERLALIDRWNYQRGLSKQFYPSTGLCSDVRVVYSASGMYLAAATLTDARVVVDTKLYWAAVVNEDEARYLCAILNSELATRLVRVFQSRGEHNPRDFHKYPWQLSIPLFDEKNSRHRKLSDLGAEAERFAASLDLPKTRFEKQRRFVREQLSETKIGQQIEKIVAGLLTK
jgi:hypothetical protein